MTTFLQSSLSKVTLVAAVVLGLNSIDANAAKFRRALGTTTVKGWNELGTWEVQDEATLLWGSAQASFPGINDEVLLEDGNKVNLTQSVTVYKLTITKLTNGAGTTSLDLNGHNLYVNNDITLESAGGNNQNAVIIENLGKVNFFGKITYTSGSATTIVTTSSVNSPYSLCRIATTSALNATGSAIKMNTLPVELVSFKATKNTSGVSLNWATASEKNNTGFEVQSSVDGKNYEAIGFVASANGTSSSLQRYAFTDKASNKEGLAYYRLKQIDLDGTFEYFTAKVVDLGRTGTAVSAYPNPFQNQFAVNLTSTVAEAAVITVSDMTGKTVYSTTAQLQKGSNTLNVTLKDQPAGIYMLNATAGNQTYINRLVKQ